MSFETPKVATALVATSSLRLNGKPSLVRDKETGLLKLTRNYEVDLEAVETEKLATAEALVEFTSADEPDDLAAVPYNVDRQSRNCGDGIFYDEEYGENFLLVTQQIEAQQNRILLSRVFQELGAAGVLVEIGQPRVSIADEQKVRLLRTFIVRNPYPGAGFEDKVTERINNPDFAYRYGSVDYPLTKEVIKGENVFSIVSRFYGDSEDSEEQFDKRQDCSYSYSVVKKGPIDSLPKMCSKRSAFDAIWPTFPEGCDWFGRTWYLTDLSVSKNEEEGEERVRYTWVSPPSNDSEMPGFNFGILRHREHEFPLPASSADFYTQQRIEYFLPNNLNHAAQIVAKGDFNFATRECVTINDTVPGILHIHKAAILELASIDARTRLTRFYQYGTDLCDDDRTVPFTIPLGAGQGSSFAVSDSPGDSTNVRGRAIVFGVNETRFGQPGTVYEERENTVVELAAFQSASAGGGGSAASTATKIVYGEVNFLYDLKGQLNYKETNAPGVPSYLYDFRADIYLCGYELVAENEFLTRRVVHRNTFSLVLDPVWQRISLNIQNAPTSFNIST